MTGIIVGVGVDACACRCSRGLSVPTLSQVRCGGATQLVVMLMAAAWHRSLSIGELQMTNEHIVQYCTSYICAGSSPQFALLIKGKWGCGKTHLIDKLTQELVQQKKISEAEIVKVSLYGVSSLEDLNERMFQALHPVLSSPYVQFAGMLIRSAIKMGANVDVNADGKSEGSITFGGIERKRKYRLKEIRKKLLIVDDLERCALSPIMVFGFFSDVIINQKLKALFIGNEEEINKDDEKLNKSYMIGKEKLIGLEFTVTPELEEAVRHFVTELQLAPHENVVVEACLSVMNTLKYENLRNVRQCVYNFSILLRVLPAEVEKEYVTEVAKIFALLFLQKSKNKLQEGQAHDAVVSFLKHGLAYDDYLARKATQKDLDLLFYLSSIPLDRCWEGLIFRGDYSRARILANYREDTEARDPRVLSTLFYVLNHWRDLNKDDFRAKIDSLLKEYLNGVYLHPGEILHISNILLIFSKIGIVDMNSSQVVDLVTEGIDKFGEKITPLRDLMDLQYAYGGFGYNEELEDFRRVRDKLSEVNRSNLNRRIAWELDVLVGNLGADTKTFVRKVLHVNGDGSYYGVPILSLIDVHRLFDKLRQISLEDQRSVAYAFDERYGKRYSNSPFSKEYYSDIPSVAKLRDLYQAATTSILYDPQALQTRNIADSWAEMHQYMVANARP